MKKVKMNIISPEDLDKISKIVSVACEDNGGSAEYYILPEHATELKDLIASKNMGYARANGFKALYRCGEKEGVSIEYDLQKNLFFAIELIKSHQRGEKV